MDGSDTFVFFFDIGRLNDKGKWWVTKKRIVILLNITLIVHTPYSAHLFFLKIRIIQFDNHEIEITIPGNFLANSGNFRSPMNH